MVNLHNTNMTNIDTKTHLATIISSLKKDYRNSKKLGKLNPLEIDYVNMIYTLLHNCGLEISNKNRRDLVTLYNRITYSSKTICYKKIIEPIHYNIKQISIQAECNDCNEVPIKEGKIYYWQEESFETTYQDIVPLVNQEYLDSKCNDTYSNFENGKNINYTNVGRICFADNQNIEYANYEITDVLGNDMSNFFTLTTIPSQTCALIVSKNIYSFGEVFIKIKKTHNNTPIIVQGIFEEQFENQFE